MSWPERLWSLGLHADHLTGPSDRPAEHAIIVRRVVSKRDIDLFSDAADIAQASNRCYVAPVRSEMHWILAATSPIIRENAVQAFVALRDGQPVGRIATIVNAATARKYGPGIGHFGMVDAIDDDAVFDVLFATARESLRFQGMVAMEGPFSLSINHETGLLVDGFDEPHFMRTNHAPAFYARHFERAAFGKAMDIVAATCRIDQSDYPERVAALKAKSTLAGEIRTDGLSYANWRREFPTILGLYNDAWADNWASVPVSVEEGKMISGLMLPVCKPSWIRIARHGGEPVAIVSQVPDVNEALQGLRGRLLPFGFAQLMWRIHGRGVTRTRFPMIGVARKWRGTRVGSLAISMLMAEAIEQARQAGVERAEISWMLESNAAILNLVRNLPAAITRTFRVYRMTF
jgi:GNAT superfamily N-acetyltransferase